MIIEFEKETDGVLIICSKIGLKKFYSDKEFDYDFPDGILPLINLGIIIALVTESSEEIKGKVFDGAMDDYKGYNLVGEQNLFIEEDDELFVLSHSEFTQICSNHKGDIEKFSFWNEQIFIKDLRAGWAMVFTQAKKRKNSSFLQTITQLIYTKNQFPFNEFYNVPKF